MPFPIRRLLPALLAAAALPAVPALAQQYWLPGGSQTFNNPGRGLVDTMNEHMLQRHMATRPGGPAAPSAGAQPGAGGGASGKGVPAAAAATTDPSFRLSNRGGTTIQEVYVSSSQDSSWGQDRLGQDVLPPGRQVILRLPVGQCVNDLRVVYSNGQASERRQVNTCALTDLFFP
ncbi:hypothetical protein [Roseomonas sp. BN140053]|uniref:hypothetical protein n=1 Tax=Roseomonas sp. BN140053 TaxID=3391898 RepID=UPI0039EBD904